MSYLDAKDPAEIITVGFDFSNVTQDPTNPVVSIGVRWGSETSPTLATVGAPSAIGAVVYQQFQAGAHLTDYNLKCLAYTPTGDRFAVDAVLPVRTRPV